VDKVITDIVSQYSKPEIVSIAKELDVDATGKSSVVLAEELIRKIRSMLEKEEDVEFSDDVFEFAETAEIIDAEGNVLDAKEEVKPEPVVSIKYPECFVYAAANPADPSCKKCRVLSECSTKRIQQRPKCFGNPKVYDPKSPECEVCLENIDGFCPNKIKEHSNGS